MAADRCRIDNLSLQVQGIILRKPGCIDTKAFLMASM